MRPEALLILRLYWPLSARSVSCALMFLNPGATNFNMYCWCHYHILVPMRPLAAWFSMKFKKSAPCPLQHLSSPWSVTCDVALRWFLFFVSLCFHLRSRASLRRSADVLSFRVSPCPSGQPVQHGAFLRDAQLVRLLARQTDLLQCLQRGSARRHLPRPVLRRYTDTHTHEYTHLETHSSKDSANSFLTGTFCTLITDSLIIIEQYLVCVTVTVWRSGFIAAYCWARQVSSQVWRTDAFQTAEWNQYFRSHNRYLRSHILFWEF